MIQKHVKLFCLCSKYLFLNTLRNRLVLFEEHGVVTTSLCGRTKFCRVTEHFSKRNKCSDDLTTANIIHRLDLTTLGIQGSDYITHVFFRHGNLYLHDRLKKYR